MSLLRMFKAASEWSPPLWWLQSPLPGGVCPEAMSLPFLSPTLPLFSSPELSSQVAYADLKGEIALLCYSNSKGPISLTLTHLPDSSQALQGVSVATQQSHCLYFATDGRRVKRVRETAWWTGGTAVLESGDEPSRSIAAAALQATLSHSVLVSGRGGSKFLAGMQLCPFETCEITAERRARFLADGFTLTGKEMV